jgi:hypothetical protein
MNLASPFGHLRGRRLLLPILVGGAVAGSLDLAAAFIFFGWGVPRAIAAGLLGRQALQGGTGVWMLGVFLQYVIAFLAAAVYCLSSRKLEFLKDHFLVCGLFYGIAVFLVMNLVVLPLCGLHATGPYQLHGLLQGLLIHMFIIGLPIAYCLRRFS